MGNWGNGRKFEFGNLRVEAEFAVEFGAMTLGEFVKHHEADVVAGALVLAARVAQADDQTDACTRIHRSFGRGAGSGERRAG